jgi:hypothetical protein
MAANGQSTPAGNNPPFSDVLKQIYFDNPAEVAKKETGKKIAERIFAEQWNTSTNVNSITGRADRWKELEDWSLGNQNMAEFLPYMGVNDADNAEANIDMTPTRIGASFVGTLVEDMAKSIEYPSVSAIDDESMAAKEDRQLEALFRMHELETIADIQNEAGVQLEPTNAYVPDSELAAKVYFEEKDRLPKEIRFEKFLKGTLLENQYEKVLKPSLLRSNVVFNLECTKVERVKPFSYLIKKCLSKNVFYNRFTNDSGKDQISYIGEFYNLKVKDIREKFGKCAEMPDGLTENEIYEFARLSTQNNPVNPVGFSHQFGSEFGDFNGRTPWDDYAGMVIDFEIEIIEPKYSVSRVDKYGKMNITPKKGVPEPTGEKSKIVKQERKRWYRCVYAPYANMVIYWGRPDSRIMDKSSYTISYSNNTGGYTPSLFERALEVLREYALTKLKRKLLIGRLSPTGFRVDVESAKNIKTGNGRVYEWEDIIRIKTLTGVELYSSVGINPMEQANPAISSASRDDTLMNIIQLSELLKSMEGEIRILLGNSIYVDGSIVGDRTANKLREGQAAASSNVYGYVLKSHQQVMEETLHKICLLFQIKKSQKMI